MSERKGFDSVQVENYSRIIFASNQNWVVPAGQSDRRYMVFDVSNSKANDRKYFQALRKEWKNGGKECFFEFLMDRNIDDCDFVNDRPQTSAMKEQKERTMGHLEQWYQHVLDEGRFYETEYSKDFELTDDSQTEIEAELVYQSYLAFCNQQRVKRKSVEKEVSRFFKSNVEGFKSKRKGKNKTTFWIFPRLTELRKMFDESYQWKTDWDSVSDDADNQGKNELYNERTNSSSTHSDEQCETEQNDHWKYEDELS